MSTATLNDIDLRIRDAVTRQLGWDPDVDASAIGVAAKDGAVTLTGFVDTYAGKLAAERAAKRVHGVRAVANAIDVRLRLPRTDVDIAQDAVRALELRSTIPGTVQAAVRNASVTLTGRVHSISQKQAAEAAVRHIRGVHGVLNHITVEPQGAVGDVRRLIARALHDAADVDVRHVAVAVSGDTATLTGSVATWLQRDAAERAAANSPGIARVVNELRVEPVHDRAWEEVDEAC